MKPVKNTVQSMFIIGKVLQCRDLDEEGSDREIVIVSIKSCMIPRCPLYGNSDRCEGIRFFDEGGDLWCGISGDFREVEE